MKYILTLLIGIATILTTDEALAQPYWGTIFVDSDIITEDDPTTFESISYIGQGMVTMYDRRVEDWVNVNAYRFQVIWNDGLTTEAQINPEFGSVAAASVESEKYGSLVGQLPYCLRVDVDELWIHMGVELYGGGNNSILIHTGQSALYEADGIIEETLVHEASHTSLDADHALSIGWIVAQDLDTTFISTYAMDNPDREDIAESYLMWLAVRHRANAISTTDYDLITQSIPNRLAYFDDMSCDLHPFVSSTAVSELAQTESGFVYPNPTTGYVRLDLNGKSQPIRVQAYDVTGRQHSISQVSSISIVEMELPEEHGLYMIVVTYKEGLEAHRVYKL